MASRDDPVNNEITLKESDDFRDARKRDVRPDHWSSNESQHRYPRNDREFGNSIREERRAVGDLYSDNNQYRQREEIDLGHFQRPGSGRPRGKPYENLEQSLGYFP
jgi:hypothetical protein